MICWVEWLSQQRCFGLDVSVACLALDAAHAKVVAVYDRPFWREKGLSGDGMSSVGPLGEIHDASPGSGAQGALFGFASWPARERAAPGLDFGQAAVKQLSAMFGPQAASPRRVFVKDW